VVKAIGQRQKTIERLVSAIVRRQSSFFAGCGPLAPMRMRDVARELHVHESTVSRAVNGKYLQCKRGVFPLKYFFSSTPCANAQGQVGSRSVKEELRALILSENSENPYSDAALASLLEQKGMRLARRTVAKYREELGILSVSLRKRAKA
jgi:RNA polymerase sigma-54 factor